jgi:hypothetical protein
LDGKGAVFPAGLRLGSGRSLTIGNTEDFTASHSVRDHLHSNILHKSVNQLWKKMRNAEKHDRIVAG